MNLQGTHKKLYYLLLVLLPTQLAAHFWPEWSFVLGRKIDYLSPTLYFTDIVVIAIFVTHIVEKIMQLGYGSTIKSLACAVWSFFASHALEILIAITYFVSNIRMSANPYVSTMLWGRFALLSVLGFYIYNSRPDVKTSILTLSISAFFSSGIALMQVWHKGSLDGILYLLGERHFTISTANIARQEICGVGSICFEYLRPYATFSHPNVMAGYLVTTIPLVIWLRKQKNSIVLHNILTISLGLTVLAVLVSLSLSAWLALSLSMMFLYYARGYKKIAHSPLLYIFIVLLVGALVYLALLLKTQSIMDRIQLYVSAFTIWLQSPIVGVGWLNSIVLLPEYQSARSMFFLQPVHNLYMLIFVECGIVGFMFAGYALLLIVKRLASGMQVLTQLQPKGAMYHPLPYVTISFIAVLVLGLFDHYFITSQQGRLLCCILFVTALNEARSVEKMCLKKSKHIH